MIDIIIVGHGPAGVSAAIYATRAGKKVILLGKDQGALAKAEQVENFYGHAEPVTGQALVEAGLAQAERLGVETVTDEVVGLQLEEYFTIETASKSYDAQAVILATGATRATPAIKGMDNFENAGVSYCAVCDAFFYRGKDVSVLGNGAYALREVLDLLPVVKSVTLLTNGKPVVTDFPQGVRIITTPLSALAGEGRLSSIRFNDDTALDTSGLFIALGVAGSTALAKKIGAVTDGNRVVVDNGMRTSVPGLWAAGDCTGGMKQIAKAVYEGALAGSEAAKYLALQPK